MNGRYLDDERFLSHLRGGRPAWMCPSSFIPGQSGGRGADEGIPPVQSRRVPHGKREQHRTTHLLRYFRQAAEPDLHLPARAGEPRPIWSAASAHGWRVRPECKNISRAPIEYLRSNFYLDMLVFHPPVVRFLVDVMGGDRVVLGTDLPYDMTDTEAVETLRQSGLSQEEYENVSHKNIQRLLNPLSGLTRTDVAYLGYHASRFRSGVSRRSRRDRLRPRGDACAGRPHRGGAIPCLTLSLPNLILNGDSRDRGAAFPPPSLKRLMPFLGAGAAGRAPWAC